MKRLAVTVLSLSLLASASAHAQTITIARSGSQPSRQGPAENFTGSVRVDAPFGPNAPSRTSGGLVTFEPGARSAWHSHPLGQILIVTAGTGRVQQWGGPIDEIRQGDVVRIPPGVKHWHGAAPATSMAHIAIVEQLDGKSTDWMEKVSDAQYRAPVRGRGSSSAAPASSAAASAEPTPAQRLIGDFSPKLVDLTDRVLFGEVWARPQLSQGDRSLVTVSALIAMNRPDQLRSHLTRARDNGVTQDELIETITHLAFYSGWPNAMTAITVAKELRLLNYAEVDPESGKPWSSKALKECYRLGAEKFGWKNRKLEPRSMRDGRWLVGWGTATGVWGAFQRTANARITLRADGTAHVTSATSDIGPGTYTVMTMIAAEYLGLRPEQVQFELGDTRFPRAPSQGGSQTTSSVGSAVYGAALAVGARLLSLANREADSPLNAAAASDVEMLDGRLRLKSDPSRFLSVSEVMRRNGLTEITETFESRPSPEREKYALLAHGAQFIEVKVDPDLGTVRVTRAIEVTACGRIINPKASHSQEIGGVVWGIGMALQEATEIDHRYGRIMNPNLQHYHVPVNADVHEIETMFVEEDDKIVNPLGVKGMGELGMVGIPAAIANAVFHATGRRIRELPITPDKLL